jgi:hypothetical protein
MNTRNPQSRKPVNAATYLIISAVSLVAAIFIGYYYFHYMKQGGTEKMDDRVFYLVLVLFGMAASALIFGIMNSYASLKGIQSNYLQIYGASCRSYTYGVRRLYVTKGFNRSVSFYKSV